jgi:hypothetical protein
MYVDTKNLPLHLQALAGSFKSVQVDAVESVTKHADDCTWSGGSRTMLSAVELSTGRAVSIVDTFKPPWDRSRTHGEIPLRPGFAILSGGHFCGKPSMPHLYVHAADLAPLLPTPDVNPLTADENVWLYCVCGLKSFARADEAKSYGLTDERIAAARQSLTARGHLSANGAATTQGKNARPERLPNRWATSESAS